MLFSSNTAFFQHSSIILKSQGQCLHSELYPFPPTFTRLCERIGPNLRKDDSCDINLFFYHELFIKKDRYGLSAMLTLAAKKVINYLGVRNFYRKKLKSHLYIRYARTRIENRLSSVCRHLHARRDSGYICKKY